MKNIIKFLGFIVFTIAIFFVTDFKIFVFLILLNFFCGILLKIDFKNMFYYIKIMFPFVLFTVVINIFFADLKEGILIGIRIFICYISTYIFSKTMTIGEIANTIEKLCFPLKIFKVNTTQIGIIISVAICMIPVLRNEISTSIKAMKSRGQNLKMNNIIIIMKPILISILKKTSEMEKTLISKGYE